MKMRIFQWRTREEFFNPLTPVEAIASALLKSKEMAGRYSNIVSGDTNITQNVLKNLESDGILVLGAENTLEEMLNHEASHNIDDDALMEKINHLKEHQIILLPKEYDVEKRERVYYGQKEYLSLNSRLIFNKIEDKYDKDGKLIKKTSASYSRGEYELDPCKALMISMEILNEKYHKIKDSGNKVRNSDNKEKLQEFMHKHLFGYKYKGKDSRWRVVPFDRLTEGAEMRAFQNIAAYFKLIDLYKKELGRGRNSRTEANLTQEERKKREKDIERYTEAIERYGYDKLSENIYFDFYDMFSIFGKASNRFIELRVPSRERKGYTQTEALLKNFYYHGLSREERGKYEELMTIVKRELTNKVLYRNCEMYDAPLLFANPQRAFSAAWNMSWHCTCEDERYHEKGPKEEDVPKGIRDLLSCAHVIAGAHFLYYESRKKQQRFDISGILYINPFPLPTERISRINDKLKYQTIIIDEEGKRRALRKAEIAYLLGMDIKKHKAEENFINIKKLKEDSEKIIDPQTYLIKIG